MTTSHRNLASGPVILLLLAAGLGWLVVGCAGLVVSFAQLLSPSFLAASPVLTYGRLYPAALNALLYGFASQCGVAAGLWLLAKLDHQPTPFPGFAAIGALFWNLAVAMGVGGILAGHTTGFDWFEMPCYAAPLLLTAFLLMSLPGPIGLRRRSPGPFHVSHWFLLTAWLAFPCCYLMAQWLLVFCPWRGVVQEAAHAWSTQVLFHLWLAPMGLALIFFLLPRLTGQPLRSRALAVFSFWTLVSLAPWSGLRVGTPLPAGLVALSSAGALALLLPAVSLVVNWAQTLRGQPGSLRHNVPLRFVCASSLCYVLAVSIAIARSFPGPARLLDFTFVHTGQEFLLLFGFAGMAVAGAIHVLVAGLTPSGSFALCFPKAQSWATLVGLGLSTLALLLAGVVQGAGWRDVNRSLSEVAQSIQPLLLVALLGLFLLAVAFLVLFVEVSRLAFRETREALRRRLSGQGTREAPGRAGDEDPRVLRNMTASGLMSRPRPILAGVLAALALSWAGSVLLARVQVGSQEPRLIEGASVPYPPPRPGLARQGQAVYVSLGCVYCHSQQVQSPVSAPDFARGWGKRRSVAQDYLLDTPVQLGVRRIGPDLANIGLRLTNEVRLLEFLYQPRLRNRESTMPPYAFLFAQRNIGRRPSAEALVLPAPYAVAAGGEIVPKSEAKALVAYLLSLQAEAPLYEAPWPVSPSPLALPLPKAATNLVQ